jgi:hypothetical protein
MEKSIEPIHPYKKIQKMSTKQAEPTLTLPMLFGN